MYSVPVITTGTNQAGQTKLVQNIGQTTLFAGLSTSNTQGIADKQHGGYLNSEVAALH